MVASIQVVVASVIALLGLLQVAISSENPELQTALTDVPSVKLHVTAKRKSMKLHEKTEFDIYATPVVSADSTSVLYNSYATFVDGDSEFTYTLVDGAAYLTTKDASDVETVRCLPPHVLPFDKILPALNDVTPIPSASVGKYSVECASGNLFKTSFVGVPYAICGSGKAGFTASSSDLDISVEYLDQPVSIPKPALSDGSSSCEPIEMATSMTPTALALATGSNIPSSASRMLKAESHMAMEAAECGCLSTPRPCIFFHGSGNPTEEAELQDTPEKTKKKYGDMHGHAPCCSTIKYSVLNTVDSGWTNDTLQEKYCDQALSMSPTSDKGTKTIDNTIIVTHSMGGDVMAGALANGKCKFSSTTSWVSLSPPMTGTMAADYIMNLCDANGVMEVAEDLMEMIGSCPISTARTTMFYQGEKYMTPSLDAAFVAAQQAYRSNVTAAMCSDSYVGIWSDYKAKSILAGTVVPHKSEKNDGLVEYLSCLAGLDETIFGDHYLDTFYRPKLNHADTAFLTGDGRLKNSQKPVKWFECLPL